MGEDCTLKKNMKSYAIYCRVSTHDQTNENQRLRLDAYAKSSNWSYDLYEEVESSRSTRPVKQALLAKLRAGIYKGVLVYKLDRWARSSTELLLEITELYNRGVNFISVTDHIDLSTASGKLQFQILSAFAEFERELIRERTMEGLARAKKQGKRLGRPPGSKDLEPRKTSGYILRHANARKKEDEVIGVNKPIEEYI